MSGYGDKTHAGLIRAGFRWNVESYERTIYDSEDRPITLRLTPAHTDGKIPYREGRPWFAFVGPFPDPARPWRSIGRFERFTDLRVFLAVG